MPKKTAILIISGNSDPKGLQPGSQLVGSGTMGLVQLQVVSFKHQIQFQDQPIVLEVTVTGGRYFDDGYPITSIRYNNMRSDAVVTTCTFIP